MPQEEQVQHIFKNKETGAEHLLPISFKKLPEASKWDDLGEGYLDKDPVSGINYAKLKKEPKAAAPKEAVPVKPKASEKPKADTPPAATPPAETPPADDDKQDDTPPAE